ncbi:MAG TPA: LPS assembly lipoprotein LptE [Stellaceae bacterium]|nr:LPS assembly lipoprotein LptE [Stellaceae bacterium]
MWWFRHGLLLVALALGGCGFHPLYARHARSGFDADLASIKVNTIRNRQGQVLAIALRDGLNPRGSRVETRYTLDVQLTSGRQDIGIRADGTASRSEVTMTAEFFLRDMKRPSDDAVVLKGITHSVSSYDILNDDYATVVAQHTAEDRTVHEIGDDILTRLELYVSKHRAPPAPS